MIQLIGLMIATYIFTRMVEIITSKDSSTITASCAFVTILVVLGCTLGLLVRGAEVINALQPFTH
jgi:hypothetical protein